MSGPIIQLHPHDCDCPECATLRAEAKREIFLSIERQRLQRARWNNSLTVAMSELANLFPTMRGVPGTSPWNVEQLIAWMNTGAPTTGSWHAAMFLLGVWNPHTKWNQEGVKMRKGASGKFDLFAAMHGWDQQHIEAALEMRKGASGKFDLFAAMNGWDQQHIEAALEWINNPFFP